MEDTAVVLDIRLAHGILHPDNLTLLLFRRVGDNGNVCFLRATVVKEERVLCRSAVVQDLVEGSSLIFGNVVPGEIRLRFQKGSTTSLYIPDGKNDIY